MSIRNDILVNLQNDMLKKIDPARGYNINVRTVKRGIYTYDEINSKPCICYWCTADVTKGQYAGRDDRILDIYCYGYSNKLDEIHNLLDDLEYYLCNDYNDNDVNTLEVGDAVIYEGGAHNPQYMFEINVKLHYSKLTTTH